MSVWYSSVLCSKTNQDSYQFSDYLEGDFDISVGKIIKAEWFFFAELSRAKRAQRSTMGNKMW